MAPSMDRPPSPAAAPANGTSGTLPTPAPLIAGTAGPLPVGPSEQESPLHVWAWLWWKYKALAAPTLIDVVDPYAEIAGPPSERTDRAYIAVHPFELQGATLATEGDSVAIVRDDDLQQDGLYSRRASTLRPSTGVLRGLAGTWPNAAFALYAPRDDAALGLQILSWKGKAWAPVRTLRSNNALLSGNSVGKVLLAENIKAKNSQAVALSDIEGHSYALSSSSGSCQTRLVEATRLEVNVRGDVLLRGRDCEQPKQPALEMLRHGATQGVRLTTGFDVLHATTLDQAGNVWITGRPSGQSQEALRRFNGTEWSETSSVGADDVSSLAVDATENVWLVTRLRDRPGQLLQRRPTRELLQVPLPKDVGAPLWVERIHNALWVGTERALLSTAVAKHVWDWIDVGVPLPIAFAPRRPHDRWGSRPRSPGCGAFSVVVLGSSTEPDLGDWAHKYKSAKRAFGLQSFDEVERGFPSQPQAYAILAREGDMYFFGVAASGSKLESLLKPFPDSIKAPAAYCSTPASFSLRRIEEFLKIDSTK